MEFHIDFRKDLRCVMSDADTAGFPRMLAKTLFDAAPDGTRSITVRCQRIGKNLYNGSAHFCDIKGVGYSKSLGNLISPVMPALELTQLALDLIGPEVEAGAEEQGTPA